MDNSVFQKTASHSSGEVPHLGVLRPEDFARDFSFVRLSAPEGLDPYVDYLWIIRWNFADAKRRLSPAILPAPQVNVFVGSNGEYGVQGIFRAQHTYEAVGKGWVAGITFKPGSLYAFWQHPTHRITDAYGSLEAIFPQAAALLAPLSSAADDTAIQTRLTALLRSVPPTPDAHIKLVQDIVQYIGNANDIRRVGDIARAFGKSERSLQQLFRTYAGVSLKWVLLRSRVVAVASTARGQADVDWSALAFDLGYASQAHFITDFKRATGLSPIAFVRLQQHGIEPHTVVQRTGD